MEYEETPVTIDAPEYPEEQYEEPNVPIYSEGDPDEYYGYYEAEAWEQEIFGNDSRVSQSFNVLAIISAVLFLNV